MWSAIRTGSASLPITCGYPRTARPLVKSLTSQHGIDAARLVPFGCGPTVPVASNANEDGRAKNRRVELVAQ